MNTRELERLGDWDEGELTEVVVALVRQHRRLPHFDELTRGRRRAGRKHGS